MEISEQLMMMMMMIIIIIIIIIIITTAYYYVFYSLLLTIVSNNRISTPLAVFVVWLVIITFIVGINHFKQKQMQQLFM
jgi:hypothetical protein